MRCYHGAMVAKKKPVRLRKHSRKRWVRVVAMYCFTVALGMTLLISSRSSSPAREDSVPTPNIRNDFGPDVFSRTAYLITVNSTSPRTRRTVGILEGVGFDVRLAFALANRRDKVVSNKLAQLLIYEQILAGPDAWGYVFEDDVMLVGESRERFEDKVHFTVAGNLPALEAEGLPVVYLGICNPGSPYPEPVFHTSGVPLFHSYNASEVPPRPNRYCGRCAHAYGVSRAGARLLLEYSRKIEKRYMDTKQTIQRRSSDSKGYSGMDQRRNVDKWRKGTVQPKGWSLD